jgi:uncharacterized protein (TIGR02145 family)
MKKILSAFAFLIIFTLLSGQDKFTDKRDGNVYNIITFNGVSWMAENLRFRPQSGAFYLDNDINNIPRYGVLYNWTTAKEVCPDGWHLPSGSEFQSLSNFLEQRDSWGKVVNDPNSFNIQFGGMRDFEGVFSEMDESGYYWTSTEYDKDNAEYFSYLLINDMPVIDISRKADIADIHGTEKTNHYSVRCVK